MADYVVSDTSLGAVADAIREKGGTSEPLEFPDGFLTAIGEISGGGDVDFYNRWTWVLTENVIGIQKYSMGYDSSAHVLRLYNANVSTNRRTLVTDRGKIPFKAANTDADTTYYPVPVPKEASKVTIQMTPSTLQMACHINKATQDGKYNQMLDTGWMDGGSFTFSADSDQFLTMGIRVNSSNSNFSTSTEPKEIMIRFSKP